MKAIWKFIESLFVDGLFIPYDVLRFMDNWWLANTVNWIFVLIGMTAFGYWMKQLKGFNERKEENKDNSAHSFL